MKDIDYFTEENLKRGNIVDFYNSLQPHLQEPFRTANHASIDILNVLRGYRGPSYMCNNGRVNQENRVNSEPIGSSNGVQEIRYWWGVKDLDPILIEYYYSYKFVQSIYGETAWSSLYFDAKNGNCLSYSKDEAADRLNDRGQQLFNEGNYSEAAEYFNNAYQFCSIGYSNEQTFKRNRDDAYDELEAIKLKEQGDVSFNQGQYGKARDNYQKARDKSNTQKRTFQTKIDKAQTELNAEILNNSGNKLFNQGEYKEAFREYQKACENTKIHDKIYQNNKNKAQAEVDAEGFNNLGDNFFTEESYESAYHYYSLAEEKSQLTSQKNIYAENKEKVLEKILTIIENLWNTAWDAENDTTKDRSDEARDLFKTVLDKSKEFLQFLPTNHKLKHYETIASLKNDANKDCNEGLELQKKGFELLKEAQEHGQQGQYQQAGNKLNEAKIKFKEAQKKFQEGIQSDQRFEDCVAFVKEQIEGIEEILEKIKNKNSSQSANRLIVRTFESNENEQQRSIINFNQIWKIQFLR